MEELYNYLDKIKYELDNCSVIKEYLKSKDKVMNNKELVGLIDKYHNTIDESKIKLGIEIKILKIKL